MRPFSTVCRPPSHLAGQADLAGLAALTNAVHRGPTAADLEARRLGAVQEFMQAVYGQPDREPSEIDQRWLAALGLSPPE